MYYYTYLVIPTNKRSTLFGKVYFGKHKTEKLDDSYIGSGKKIRRYIKKYPNDYYREIIKFYSSEEELNKAEYELIHPHLGKKYCLNLQEGGIGGYHSQTIKTRKKISIALKGKSKPPRTDEHKYKLGSSNRNKKLSDEHKNNISIGGKESYKNGRVRGMKDKHPSEKTKKQMSASHIGKPSPIKGKHKVYDDKERNIYHYE